MSKMFQDVISTEEQFAELRSVYGQPGERAAKKVISYLDQQCRDFIAKSPFLSMATSLIRLGQRNLWCLSLFMGMDID
ncbi:hypothetical protein [Brevibacillus choshinensis]|uniref:hypothetical protein n=1 Tax=Brevibacillus choshinensis TaxID=54911 RepID=UPI002E1DCD2D|nr:hypothetical protein [Brevibacillus choshinensis]